MTQNNDKLYFNILKGLGAILVVMGHCCKDITFFIYLFHMPLFFYISGFLYNEDKYSTRPMTLIWNRLKKNWPGYFIAGSVFILLHNILIQWNLQPAWIPSWSKGQMIVGILKTALLSNDEWLVSPIWFIPVLICSNAIWALLVWLLHKWQGLGKEILLFLFSAGMGAVGYFLLLNIKQLYANLQITLAVMPFLWAGYATKKFISQWNKYLNIYASLIILAVLYFVSLKYHMSLKNFLVFPGMYLTALLGIYACMSFADVICRAGRGKEENTISQNDEKDKKTASNLASCIALIGESSYILMIVHYPILRLIDKVYSIVRQDPALYFDNWLGVHNELLPFYLSLGIFVPVGLHVVYGKLKKKMKN